MVVIWNHKIHNVSLGIKVFVCSKFHQNMKNENNIPIAGDRIPKF
jgi:hypothetical protein